MTISLKTEGHVSVSQTSHLRFDFEQHGSRNDHHELSIAPDQPTFDGAAEGLAYLFDGADGDLTWIVHGSA